MSHSDSGQGVELEDDRQAAVRLVVDTVARLARLAEGGVGSDGIETEIQSFKSRHHGVRVTPRAGSESVELTEFLRRILRREARAYWNLAAQLDGEGAREAALQRRRVSVLLDGAADALGPGLRTTIPSETVLSPARVGMTRRGRGTSKTP